MKNKIKDDEKHLLKNEELNSTLLGSFPTRPFPERLALKEQINETFDSGTDIQNPNEYYTSGTPCQIQDATTKYCFEDTAACVDERRAKMEISAISGVTVAYVGAHEVNGRCYGSSFKGLRDLLSSYNTKKQLPDRRTRRVLNNERALSCSDYSRALYSAIYIDTNLTAPHFGDI